MYEIRAALRHEKEFVPLLIDGAKMPQLYGLAKDIRKLLLHFHNGAIEATQRDLIGKIGRPAGPGLMSPLDSATITFAQSIPISSEY